MKCIAIPTIAFFFFPQVAAISWLPLLGSTSFSTFVQMIFDQKKAIKAFGFPSTPASILFFSASDQRSL